MADVPRRGDDASFGDGVLKAPEALGAKSVMGRALVWKLARS